MSNLTDALIAAKLMGNGGGGGGGGLPPITTETTTILAEQSVAFSNQGGMYIGGVSGQYTINVGDSITVNWDGTPYECVVGEVMGFAVWGNLSLAGMGADTGEPFMMPYNPEAGIDMYAASGETHTVGLTSTSYTPLAGSILIVESGEWAEKLLSDYLPVNISVSSSTAVTVSAKDIYVFTGSITALGAPASWKTCGCYASNLVTNGSSQPTGLQVANASLDLTAGTAQIVFVNNTAASITTTGGFTFGGAFSRLS